MAEDLNINSCWFHDCNHPHYDIPKRRLNEIESKCTIISSKKLLSKIKESR